jgi:hypothetical protein
VYLKSKTVGVAHALAASSTVLAAPSKVVSPVCPGVGVSLCCAPFSTVGVGHADIDTAWPNVRPNPLPFPCFLFSASRRSCHVVSPSFCGPLFGVGHPPQPLPSVRSPDAASRQIRRRNGVTCSFQVSVNMIEPSESSRSCNLLAKHCCRVALADETEERRP